MPDTIKKNIYLLHFHKLPLRWTNILILNEEAEHVCETETDSRIENSLVASKGEAAGGGWTVGESRCKVLHMELVNSKVLLYSTENYFHGPLINHNEK